MSRQDKATTERHTRTLRELVKRPENKVCADCKRNDPRWASWNIGVFMCIRCSGIHRSMGTHISKVKSVDLDTWTPEQMASILKWGNSRANAYWEAHLKPGHIPPEHKIESFIRSKYESKRWAMEGPPPDDPSVFDNAGSAAIEPAPAAATPPPAAAPSGRPTAVTPAQPVGPIRTAGVATTQPQGRQLLSTTIAGRAVAPLQSAAPAPAPAPVAAHAPVPAPQDDLFSLDFHAPPVTASATGSNGGGARKDKQDILSLFNSAPAAAAAAAPAPAALGTFGNFSAAQPVAATQSSPWDAFGSAPAQPQQSTQPQSFVGNTGVGMWGASSGWNAQAAAPAQPHVWAPASSAQQPQQALFNTSSVWGGAPAAANSTTAPDPFGSFGGSTTGAATQKKDDAFGDIWGSFK